MIEKPEPTPNADTLPFWEACNREELLFQHCQKCGHDQFYPRRICKQCGSQDLEWRNADLQGTVYSFTIQHRAPTPAFREDVPYIIALVDLEPGIRMMMNVKNCSLEDICVGMPVRIIFEDRGKYKIPQVVPILSEET